MGFQIAIDGPSGSGKSTIAKTLAKELDFIYIDTGAMYRAIGLYVFENNIELNDSIIKKYLDEIIIKLEFINNEQNIFLNDENVTTKIRTQNIADYASKVATFPSVRDKLVAMQKKIGEKNNIVMDGRDIGTIVLPNAELKIYLDASVDIRAKRRTKELENIGELPNYFTIKKEMEDRDYRDKNRNVNPLIMAEDGIYIDSSNLAIDKVLCKIIKEYKKIIKN